MLLTNLLRRCSNKLSRDYLRFGDSGKAFVYRSHWTRGMINLAIGSVSAATFSNMYFLSMEYKRQYFGSASFVSASILSTMGLAFIASYFVLLPRVVRNIKILKNMREVEISFFPRIREKTPSIFDISDLSGLRKSSFGFHVFDSHKQGKIWIMMRANEVKVYPGMEDFLVNTLKGNCPGKDEIEKKAHKFKPKM